MQLNSITIMDLVAFGGAFFMLTAFCLAKSSKRLHDKFIGTKMYEKHLKSFAEKKGMLMKTKLSVMTTVTVLMGFGFFIPEMEKYSPPDRH